MFSIITPCTRLHFLSRIKESMEPFKDLVTWYIVYDSQTLTKNFQSEPWIVEANCFLEGGVVGNFQRNLALEMIKDNSWVYPLDDDNLLHPELIPTILTVNGPEGVTFDQQLNGSVRTGTDIRQTHIDQAQFILKRDLIGDTRWNPWNYCADGEFIEYIYTNNKSRFTYINKILCYYNRLWW